MADLAQLIADKLASSGWRVQRQEQALRAEKGAILAKWLLGTRKLSRCLALKFDAARRELVLQETANETCFGIPPPSFTKSSWKQQGLQYSEERTDAGWGGGALHFGQERQWLEELAAREGWTFRLHVGAVG